MQLHVPQGNYLEDYQELLHSGLPFSAMCKFPRDSDALAWFCAAGWCAAPVAGMLKVELAGQTCAKQRGCADVKRQK